MQAAAKKVEQRIIETEKIVLGTLLTYPALYFDVSDYFSPLLFTSEATKGLAEKMIEHIEKYDTIRLRAFAKKNATPFFGESDIANLVNYSSTVTFFDDCQLLKNNFIADTEIDLAQKTIGRLNQGEHYEDVLSEIDNERGVAMSLVERKGADRAKDFKSAKDGIHKAYQAKKEGGIVGIPTGLSEVDAFTSGFHPTDLNIVAARPGMGKSTLCFCYALSAAAQGRPVLIVSLEMGKSQIIQKMASIKTGITVERIRAGELTEQELFTLDSMIDAIYELPLYIEDQYFDIDKIANRVSYYKRRKKIELVVLDYLQLCKKRGKDSEYELVTACSKQSKEIAKKNDLCFIAISQLSRKVEDKGGSKRPGMSDLRSSGQLEQDADLIQMVYRADYYGIVQNENGESTKGVAELIFVKNRHGRTGTIMTKFNGAFSDYYTPDLDYPNPDNNILITRNQKANDDDIPF